MLQLVHDQHGRSRLDEIETEVFEAVSHMCLRVGELLHEAQSLDRAGFRTWVDERMPFGYDKARRLIAIHLAYRELPPETIQQLPEPWQALYALRHWAGGKLTEAIETGEIGPDTTVVEAARKARFWSNNTPKGDGLDARYTSADVRAGALMNHHVSELNPLVRDALARWLAHDATWSRTAHLPGAAADGRVTSR